MLSGSPHIYLFHSPAKYFTHTAPSEIKGKFIAFSGDRGVISPQPQAVILPPIKAWTWASIRANENPIRVAEFFQQEGNTNKFWTEAEVATHNIITVPRLVYLPTILIPYLLEKPHTPYTLGPAGAHPATSGEFGVPLRATRRGNVARMVLDGGTGHGSKPKLVVRRNRCGTGTYPVPNV